MNEEGKIIVLSENYVALMMMMIMMVFGASPLHRRPLAVSLGWVLGNWEMEKDRDSASSIL